MQHDYYSALARVVMTSARNDPRLRRIIYDLARRKLRDQIDPEFRELRDSNGSEQLVALESAIEQIEVDLARQMPNHLLTDNRPARPQGTIEIIPPSPLWPPPNERELEFTPHHTIRRSVSFRSTLAFIGLLILGALTYLAFQREFGDSQLEADPHANISGRDGPSGLSDVPTPSSYGVYAFANGQLAELESLPIRVPEGRTAVTATITTQSTTKLPISRIQFIVFKRDLVNNSPEKVVVRMLKCAICVESAGATTSNIVGETWTLSSIFYDMRVAPVRGNPAMIIIRSADTDFSFPAGRY